MKKEYELVLRIFVSLVIKDIFCFGSVFSDFDYQGDGGFIEWI